MPDLILASTSAYRRQLLERLGQSFRQVPPDCDEAPLHTAGLEPETLAVRLARLKAESVAHRHPTAVIIGSDQVAALDDHILHKPGSVAVAVEQLERLVGRSHRLLTAVCVIHGDQRWEHCDRTVLHARQLDRAALQRLVERDQPLDCAGSYKLESGGITLFEGIDSEDHSAITGLPLIWLTGILRSIGFAVP